MVRLNARAHMLLAAEKRTLEMIANGASLRDVLDDLCRTVDAHSPPAISTVEDVSLCLYRVLQEALYNAINFSRSRQFEVHLTGDLNEIHLRIRDEGIGFDPDAVKGKGIGLTMHERMKSVGGELLIESQPQLGTTIYARVPQKRADIVAAFSPRSAKRPPTG